MDMNKLAFIVFSIVLGALVYVGKVDSAALIAIGAYLAPSPMAKKAASNTDGAE